MKINNFFRKAATMAAMMLLVIFATACKSQEDTETAKGECENGNHQWVQQYTEEEGSKCSCGWEGVDWEGHYAASNVVTRVNAGTNDNPWWVDVDSCELIENTTVEVPDGYICSVCGARKAE